MDTRELRFSRAMAFAIDEINNSTDLLPGVALGYKIHDSCSSAPMAVQGAFQFTNDPSLYKNSIECSPMGRVLAVIGDTGSTTSISLSRIIGPFGISQVFMSLCRTLPFLCLYFVKMHRNVEFTPLG
jgi:hypothetical protein